MRTFLFVVLLGIALVPVDRLLAGSGDQIIAETTAQRHGLTRPWVTQVQLDRGRARVRDIVLYEGTLYVQTDRAMLHAIDAETGQTLWAKQVGRPDHPSLRPSASFDLLATVNGSHLYVMNRYNGDVLYDTDVKGAPGAGPVLTRKRVYVPMVTGMVLSYRLEPLTDPNKELMKVEKLEGTEEEKKAKLREREEERRQNIRLAQNSPPPLAMQSAGRILAQPVTTYEDGNEEYVAWVTDRGYLNVARIDRRDDKKFELKFRVRANASMVASPSYLPPVRKLPVVAEAKPPEGGPEAKNPAGEAKKPEADEKPAADDANNPLDPAEKPAADAKKGGLREGKKHAADVKRSAELGIIYCTSLDGNVRASRERSGEEYWKFSTAEPIIEPAAVVEDRVFVATQPGGMYCLDSKTGKQHWWSPEITRFLAASKDRIYAADKLGRTVVLDGKTGGRIDVLPTEMLPVKVTNCQTDRIYLGTEAGLLQCLHEAEQMQPIQYGEDRKPPREEERKAEKLKPGARDKSKPRDRPREKARPAPKKPDEGGASPDDLLGPEEPAKKPAAKKPVPAKKPAKVPKGKEAAAEEGGGELGGDPGGEPPADKPTKKATTKKPAPKAKAGKDAKAKPAEDELGN